MTMHPATGTLVIPYAHWEKMLPHPNLTQKQRQQVIAFRAQMMAKDAVAFGDGSPYIDTDPTEFAFGKDIAPLFTNGQLWASGRVAHGSTWMQSVAMRTGLPIPGRSPIDVEKIEETKPEINPALEALGASAVLLMKRHFEWAHNLIKSGQADTNGVTRIVYNLMGGPDINLAEIAIHGGIAISETALLDPTVVIPYASIGAGINLTNNTVDLINTIISQFLKSSGADDELIKSLLSPLVQGNVVIATNMDPKPTDTKGWAQAAFARGSQKLFPGRDYFGGFLLGIAYQHELFHSGHPATLPDVLDHEAVHQTGFLVDAFMGMSGKMRTAIHEAYADLGAQVLRLQTGRLDIYAEHFYPELAKEHGPFDRYPDLPATPEENPLYWLLNGMGVGFLNNVRVNAKGDLEPSKLPQLLRHIDPNVPAHRDHPTSGTATITLDYGKIPDLSRSLEQQIAIEQDDGHEIAQAISAVHRMHTKAFDGDPYFTFIIETLALKLSSLAETPIVNRIMLAQMELMAANILDKMVSSGDLPEKFKKYNFTDIIFSNWNEELKGLYELKLPKLGEMETQVNNIKPDLNTSEILEKRKGFMRMLASFIGQGYRPS